MVRLMIMSALVCAAPATGNWVLKSGEVVEKPCPSSIQMSDKARLPQGCVAHQAGVWLSRQTYTDGEVERVRLQHRLEAAREREEILQQRIINLEAQLSMTTVAGVCPACNCTSSILTSTVIATGACAAWTLYNSQR